MDETHPRSIGIDAIYQYTGAGVQLFSGAVFYIIIARMFNTTDIGAIALFLAIVGLFNVIFSFGLGTAAQHFTSFNIGSGDLPAVRRTIFKIITWGFAVSIAGFLTLIVLSPMVSLIFLHSYQYTTLVKLLSIVLVGNILIGILNGALLGLQNFRTSAILSIIVWIIYYFGAVIFAYLSHSIDTIVFGWIAGISVGICLELFIVLMQIKHFKGHGTPPSNSRILRYSLPIVMSGIVSFGASYADRFVVAGLLSLSELGVYNFTLLISASIGFIVSPFNSILMPKFSELYGNGKTSVISDQVRASSLLLTSIYVPVAVGIAALSKPILDLVAGFSYAGASEPLSIIMFFSAIFIVSNILLQAIASVRRTDIFIYVSIATLASNVVLSLLLIPRLGLIGASIGYSSIYGVTFIFLYYFAWKLKLIKLDIAGIVKVWISAVIMFIVVKLVQFFLSPIYNNSMVLVPLYILIGVSVYIILGKSLIIFGGEDRNSILSLFPEKYPMIRKLLNFFIKT